MDALLHELGQFLASRILKQPERELDADEPLISSGLIDSFSLVDVALFVEETYGVRIEDTELNSQTLDTLRQLGALVDARRGR